MELIKSTKVTKENQIDFFNVLYQVQSLPTNQLIDLNAYELPIVLVDSCGWHYRTRFPTKTTILVEGIQFCKTFNINSNQVNKLFDDRLDIPKIPKLSACESVLVLDQSPILFKYRSVDEICNIVNQLCIASNASILRMRIPLVTINDNRFQDRIKDLINLVPNSYITSYFNYDTFMIDAEFRKGKVYEININ